MKIAPCYSFPEGFKVFVKVLTHKEFMRRKYRSCHAVWNVDTRTVYLKKERSYEEHIDDLIHELDHAWNDIKYLMRQELLK